MSFEEHAQNGVRRDLVPYPIGGARRTLCASKNPAQRLKAGMDDYLPKPVDLPLLAQAIERREEAAPRTRETESLAR